MKRHPAARAALALFHNGHLLAMVLLVLGAAGASSLFSLPLTEDPRITMRGPIVLTRLPGASPERVEALVTEKIERELEEVDAIREVDSTSRAGISSVAITLHDHVYDTDAVFSEIRDQIAAAVPELPPEASAPEFDDKRGATSFSLIAALRIEDDEQLGIATRLAEALADRLRGVPGTELVRIYGEPHEELVAVVDDAELAAIGWTPGRLAQAIAGADAKTPSGRFRSAESDLILEVRGAFESADRVRRIPLQSDADGSVLRVADVARVERRWQEPTRELGLVDGERAIFVAARMGPRQRADAWAERARAELDAFAPALGGAGSPIRLDLVFDQSHYTIERLASLGGNLLLGAIVVVGVILFTMGLRAGLVVGSALPLAVSLALFGLLSTGGTLQQMSVFGMMMALGLLIDNAIVVVDEVAAQLRSGLGRGDAVAAAIEHLFGPLLASTLTTVLSFAPIPLLIGNVGDFVGPIGVAVILALVASFTLSMTLIPALAGRFLPLPGATPAPGGFSFHADGVQWPRLTAIARRGLRLGFERPALGIAVAAALPLLGFAVAPLLGSQFFPPVDRNMFDVQVWLPRDASLERTRETVDRVEAVIRAQDGVERTAWVVGGSFPSVFYNLLMNNDDASHYARGFVETGSAAQVKAMLPGLQRALDDAIPGAQVLVRSFGQGPPIDAEVEIELRGPSLAVLQSLGEAVRQRVAARPEVLHTQVTLERGDPKLWIDVDEDEARLAGLQLRDVAAQLDGRFEGRTGGSLVEGSEELPVRVRTRNDLRGSRAAIADTQLVNDAGWVPLAAIGDARLQPELGGITRCAGERCNEVRAYLEAGVLPIDVTTAVLADLETSGFALPPGYTMSVGGDTEESNAAISSLLTYAPILGVLMLATVVLSFRSGLLAAILFGVAGLSAGVGLLATWLAGFPFSFNSILGTAGLIGVALNDAIVVLAAIRSDPRAAEGEVDALVDAVLSCGRHVLSTTFTTIGGFLPLLLFVGGDFWPPLAVVLAGGVAGATILATLFVPASVRWMTRRGRAVPRAAPVLA